LIVSAKGSKNTENVFVALYFAYMYWRTSAGKPLTAYKRQLKTSYVPLTMLCAASTTAPVATIESSRNQTNIFCFQKDGSCFFDKSENSAR